MRMSATHLRVHPRRRGYVLLATLALLVLCATLLVSLSRIAMDESLRARLAQDELQRRWGAISCRNTILASAESLLLEAEARRQLPVASLQFNIRLGKHTFDLLLADEQAKVNVNHLLEISGRSSAENRLRQSLVGTGLMNALRLHPNPTPAPMPRRVAPPLAGQNPRPGPVVSDHITGLGQIFDLTQSAPDRLLTPTGPAHFVTFCTTGHLNIRRAPEPALRLALGGVLTASEISSLIDARKPLYAPLPNRSRLQLDVPQSPTVPPVTESSYCHSLWITTQTPHRLHLEFHALEISDPLRPRLISFIW